MLVRRHARMWLSTLPIVHCDRILFEGVHILTEINIKAQDAHRFNEAQSFAKTWSDLILLDKDRKSK